MSYTITGYSTALFSTWIFIEDLGILFDAGDGLSAGLLQKARKIKQAFISHADRDHLTGLMQFNQLNARAGFPKIYYPADSGSFPFLNDFLEQFDPHVQGTEWFPIKENQSIPIKGNLHVESIRNGHVAVEASKTKSLSYQVVEKKRKIKKELEQLSGPEIAKLAKEHGKDFITQEYKRKLIGYSGDTPVEDYERWNGTQVLIHEATFLDDQVGLKEHANKHSNLEDVMEMIANIEIESLILSHFSSRYSATEIDQKIKDLIKKYGIEIPVFRILPGQIHSDILNQTPIL